MNAKKLLAIIAMLAATGSAFAQQSGSMTTMSRADAQAASMQTPAKAMTDTFTSGVI
ncbi:MAG: hypothetical protein V4632_00410 [Pseudomonadota bacterium]